MTTTSENAYARAGVGFIETFTGMKFSLELPVFSIEDIAHSLSMNCRYNGHCRVFYSVAEHSVLVADIMQFMDLGDPLEGLLHDGTEAYLSDVPAPFKQYLPDWSGIDHKLEDKLRAHFNVGPKTKGCKTADWIALFIEAYRLLPDQGECFLDPENLRPTAMNLMKDRGWDIDCLTPARAEHWFLRRYQTITRRAA